MKYFWVILICIADLLLFGCKPPRSAAMAAETGKETVLAAIGQEESMSKLTMDANEQDDEPVVCKVYIENSASMDGYVNGATDFKKFLYDYCSLLRNHGGKLEFYYANKRIIPYKASLEDFIQNLTPQTFRARGGDRSNTELPELIESILEDMEEDNVALIVSDFLYSPKEESYISRDTWIQNIFSEYLRKHPDNALIVYRLESEFKGNYYDRDDDRFSIDAQRPYFIWITGPSDCLQTLVNSYSLKTLSRGKTANALFLDPRDAIEVPYNIVLGSGNFRLDRRDPHAIVDARKNVRGIETNLLTFRVNVSLEALFCSEDYLLDPANYELGDRDYKLTVSRSQNPGFTHTLSFSSPIVKPSLLNVQLKKKLPSWVVQYDDPIGDGISDTLMSKTYGLAYLLKGAWAAYTLHNDTYATIRVKIN